MFHHPRRPRPAVDVSPLRRRRPGLAVDVADHRRRRRGLSSPPPAEVENVTLIYKNYHIIHRYHKDDPTPLFRNDTTADGLRRSVHDDPTVAPKIFRLRRARDRRVAWRPAQWKVRRPDSRRARTAAATTTTCDAARPTTPAEAAGTSRRGVRVWRRSDAKRTNGGDPTVSHHFRRPSSQDFLWSNRRIAAVRAREAGWTPHFGDASGDVLAAACANLEAIGEGRRRGGRRPGRDGEVKIEVVRSTPNSEGLRETVLRGHGRNLVAVGRHMSKGRRPDGVPGVSPAVVPRVLPANRRIAAVRERGRGQRPNFDSGLRRFQGRRRAISARFGRRRNPPRRRRRLAVRSAADDRPPPNRIRLLEKVARSILKPSSGDGRRRGPNAETAATRRCPTPFAGRRPRTFAGQPSDGRHAPTDGFPTTPLRRWPVVVSPSPSLSFGTDLSPSPPQGKFRKAAARG